jgi:hypothetical protein
MIDFERYLVNNGFSVKRKVFKNNKWSYIDGYSAPSTMMNIDNRYIKDDIEFVVGLNEVNKPITLICPRPNIIHNEDDKTLDDIMNICMSKYSSDEIYKAIINKKPLTI